ncbi:MAG: hypothetical protein AAB404_02880 [Patescibacteria group bacterium]
MTKLNKNAVGLALGTFVALAHLGWLILIGIGLAKPLYDLILKLHHISLSYTILPLSLGLAIGLLVMTFIVGYIFGWVFATLWNKFGK